MTRVPEVKRPTGMAPIEHRIIRASAGTGKTYSLSNRYLALLRRGVLPLGQPGRRGVQPSRPGPPRQTSRPN